MTEGRPKCPLEAVDRRLDDLHRQWHQAQDAYFDPDGFRVAIQTAIQTLRTVSFILQNNKRVIPDFDVWYGAWQDKMRGLPLLVWMREARNRIEKQGDLETHSFVKAEIVASYLPSGPSIEVPAKLFDGPEALVSSIPKNAAGDHIRKDGVLRISRRWVENSLPEHELLDAVSIAYGHLAEVVADAHRQMGLMDRHDSDLLQGRLPCMVGHGDRRRLDVWLSTGQPLEFETVTEAVEVKDAEKLVERYGIQPADIFGKAETAEGTLANLFETARIMFLRDGRHAMIAILLKGTKPVDIRELRPGEHGHKYIMMRNLANEVIRFNADGVILISEAWRTVYSPAAPYRRAVDAPDRSEVLDGTLVTRQGEPLHLSATIRRRGGAVTLTDTEEKRGGGHALFAPVYIAWRKPIPKAWSGPLPTQES